MVPQILEKKKRSEIFSNRAKKFYNFDDHQRPRISEREHLHDGQRREQRPRLGQEPAIFNEKSNQGPAVADEQHRQPGLARAGTETIKTMTEILSNASDY